MNFLCGYRIKEYKNRLYQRVFFFFLVCVCVEGVL